jgi:phosphoglycolate phosphatase
MHRRHLVLFDIDGTLLNSFGCGRAASRLAMQEVFGTTGRVDEVNFAGKTDWQILLDALGPAGITRKRVQALLATYNQAVTHHLRQIIADFPVRACAGAPEVLRTLRQNPAVVVGLVTGNMAGLVPIKLQAARYDPADFHVGAYGSEGWTRAMLPPLALERARAYSQADFAPHDIVIIGDTPHDITCADSVQARTIAVATGPYSIDELRGHQPDYVFESMVDPGAILAAILPDGHA